MRQNKVVIVVAVMMTALVFEAKASSGGVPLWDKKAKPEEQKAKTPEPVAAERKSESSSATPAVDDLARQRALINTRRAQLDGTTWEIELIPLSGKGKNKTDVIIFSDRKVILESLAKEGFAPTNFSLSMRNNKKLVWETMQKKDADIVFFKGELTPELDSMNGVISFQRLKGTQDFSFRSTAKKEAAPE